MLKAKDSPDSHAHPSPLPVRVTAKGFVEFLEISPDALILVSHAGTVVMVNEQTESLFGYSREELLG